MQLPFRNGIVQYQATNNDPAFPTFLTRTGSGTYRINLVTSNRDFIASFSHGTAEYLMAWKTDVVNAWGPFNDGVSHYLYIDIHRVTGTVTFGSSLLPILYGSSFPTSPANDQHFYHTGDNQTYVWNNSAWIGKIRVFVGVVTSSTITMYQRGSTTGAIGSYPSGYIVYGFNNRPVIKPDKTFLTTEDEVLVNNVSGNAIKLEHSIVQAEAAANLGAYRVVKFTSFNQINYAGYSDTAAAVVGLTTEPLTTGELTNIIISGKVTNSDWNWPNVNAPLWIDANGVLTTTDPILANPTFIQQPPIARVIDTTSIVFNQMITANVGSSARFFVLEAEPESTLGEDNDAAFDKVSRTLYTKSSGVWSIETKLGQYFNNVVGVPENTVGSDGEYAISDNQIIYQKQAGVWVEIFTGGGGGSGNVTMNWTDINGQVGGTTYAAQVGDYILTDPTNGNILINLPSAAVEDDVVFVGQKVNVSGVNTVTISGNGANIAGQAEDILLDVAFMAIQFVRRADPFGWAILPSGISNVVGEQPTNILTIIGPDSANIQPGTESLAIVSALPEYSSLTLSQIKQYAISNTENVMYDQRTLGVVDVLAIVLPTAPVQGQTHLLMPMFNIVDLSTMVPADIFVVTIDEPLYDNIDGCVLLDNHTPTWATFNAGSWYITTTNSTILPSTVN